jgi:hypothetical protein
MDTRLNGKKGDDVSMIMTRPSQNGHLYIDIHTRARLALHKSHIANPHLRVQHVSSHLETCGGQNSNFSLFIR